MMVDKEIKEAYIETFNQCTEPWYLHPNEIAYQLVKIPLGIEYTISDILDLVETGLSEYRELFTPDTKAAVFHGFDVPNDTTECHYQHILSLMQYGIVEHNKMVDLEPYQYHFIAIYDGILRYQMDNLQQTTVN